jgi:Cu(I)/Ag(I) efflux system membrane protein CusA/SilA
MLMHIRSSLLISGLLPLAVLMTFIAMKIFHVDANIVALSGIAIAIGTIVDMGVVIVENILKHLDDADENEPTLHIIYRATVEVGSAVVTAVATTVISFLPVFTMEAAEGKLFRPLAFTKTFALISSIIVAITVIPPVAHLFFIRRKKSTVRASIVKDALLITGGLIIAQWYLWLGILLIFLGILKIFSPKLPSKLSKYTPLFTNLMLVLFVGVLLSEEWLPLGPSRGLFFNFLFVALLIGGILGFFQAFQWFYPKILQWAMSHRALFLSIPATIALLGGMAWLGFNSFFGWLPDPILRMPPVSALAHRFPGLGKEFMPPLDEGSYLYMPTTSVHASIDEAKDVLQKQDMGFRLIPEVDTAVGKLGRAETALDPAPISMIETVINYKSEFIVDQTGHYLLFSFDKDQNDQFRDRDGTPLLAPDGKPYIVEGSFLRNDRGTLIPYEDGVPFRQWRSALDPGLNPDREAWKGILKPTDIWDEIIAMGKLPGSTSAPKLQPIAARMVMLQSGMRAPMGVKVYGPDLKTIESVGLQLEKFLKKVPSIQADAVIADRIIGKPYLEYEIDREAIARYGIMQDTVQKVLMVAIGGTKISDTVEGRERFPIRVRYSRELRNSWENLQKVLVPAPGGAQIPLDQLATLNYVKGPQVIKSEDTFLTSYVIFDKKPGYAEVDVVEQADAYLKEMIENKSLVIPAGVKYKFAGNYENQIRASAKLRIMLPLALFVIFLILYFQFKNTATTLLVFSGIIVAWSGGFLLLWLYNQSWFLDFSFLGVNLRELFQIHPINLSVAVWVGFLALFGIATDDGVIVGTYLCQVFDRRKPGTIQEIRSATLEAGIRRVRPATMTVATTVIALIPIFTSTGRGSDIMIPMAIPSFGGMMVVIITIFVVPVLFSLLQEIQLMFFNK